MPNRFDPSGDDDDGGEGLDSGSWRPRNAKRRLTNLRSWLVGCLVVVAIALACCAGAVFYAYKFSRTVGAGVIQAQATALAGTTDAAVCQYNAPSYLASMPCSAYVAWIRQHAPFLPGSVVQSEHVDFQSDSRRSAHILIRVSAHGPRGRGTITFMLSPVDSEWRIDGVVL